MNITQALALVYGALVHCPPDRGEAPYAGTVRHVGQQVCKNIHGTEYVWVTVRRLDGRSAHVWPSNRLS